MSYSNLKKGNRGTVFPRYLTGITFLKKMDPYILFWPNLPLIYHFSPQQAVLGETFTPLFAHFVILFQFLVHSQVLKFIPVKLLKSFSYVLNCIHSYVVTCSQFHQHFMSSFCANILLPKNSKLNFNYRKAAQSTFVQKIIA